MLSEVFSSLAPLRATSSASVPALICLYCTTDVSENRVSQLPTKEYRGKEVKVETKSARRYDESEDKGNNGGCCIHNYHCNSHSC